ncbi:MAG TPA: hypothetical protein VGQ29_15250 [Gemmatimonadales bacterium]|jgi:hypothetical protein|nr:hypothetical protein [Gemmatimonadales bacterium]
MILQLVRKLSSRWRLKRSYLPVRVAVECIDDAIVLSRRYFWPLLRLSVFPFLVYMAALYYLNERFVPLWIRLLMSLVVYGLYGLLEAVTIVGAWELLHGRAIQFGKTWRRVLQRGISVFFSSLIRVFLIYLGVVLLIVPGLYFLAIYFAVPTVNVIEGLGVRASLLRSRSLALGSLTGIVLSMGVLWILVVLVAYLIPRILMELGVPPSSIIRLVCSLGWAAVIVPFRSALAARVYLEIRARKEGYDLQHLMASLPSAA